MTYTLTVPQSIVDTVKRAVVDVIISLGLPEYLTKGNVIFRLRGKNITIEGHDQYFSRVVNEAILEARIDGWKWSAWSNVRDGNKSRTYKKVWA